ncbi:uncharacterized protein LOC112570681 isoform X3 [Pomacea canaliculata]|uniref:uncharacterized protein LOC112570681 isoform X3 n=1 Tax=Pomacea canaliculata TaxID=400727 RepID=UPI000D73DD4B|nr:uncharacterized protein LOC112570681 isoform X3 [Pomacea canaliculata]
MPRVVWSPRYLSSTFRSTIPSICSSLLLGAKRPDKLTGRKLWTMDKPNSNTKSPKKKTSPTQLQLPRPRNTRAEIRDPEAKDAKENYLNMTLEQKREFSACGPKDFKTLSDIPTWPEYYANLKTSKSKSAEKGTNISKYKVNEAFNKKLSLIRADITTLEVDAIVNAANQTLLGGGGVDGAIHAAAGKQLKKECATLGGCETGDAKITEGYKLPAKHVIHTVGPIGEIPDKLQSCYRASLNLVKENNLKSVAFPCISTGIYGYPVKAATDVALQTIREWLEKDKYADKIERIILCLFLKKDVEVYEQLLQVYFPLPEHGHSSDREADATTDPVMVPQPTSRL